MQDQSPYTSVPPNSTMALVSLIAGILGLTVLPGVASIVAIIAGGMARKEIRESGGRLGGDGMARFGIILGWIAVGLVVIGGCCFAIFFILPLLGVALAEFSLLPGIVSIFV